jgi:hypothetical protein
MAEEYFIRGPEEETARGPYGIDELVTLAEAGKIDQEYYYFDPRMESWAMIRTNPDLQAKVFPEKKKLSLRKKTDAEITSINANEDQRPPVKVEEMLAAAEGNTEETSYVRQKRLWQERTASLSVPLLGIMLVVSALSVLYPSWNTLSAILNEQEGAYWMLFQRPLLLLGALDLIMGIFLFLNATEIYPLIRFRAALGAGFFTAIYAAGYINGDPQGLWLAVSNMAFGIGLYVCTLTLNFPLMVGSAAVGLAGALGIAWYSNLVPLLLGS